MPAPIHVAIPEPCHENWQQLTHGEQGRHCLSCQKTVVDFTLMSDQEILNYISRASSSVCGRFNNDQLNKTYAEKKIKPSFTFRYAWNMITAAFLLTGSVATAQLKKTLKKKTAIKSTWEFKLETGQQFTTLGFVVSAQERSRIVDPLLKMYGLIRDISTWKPISAASVRLKGVKAGVEAGKDGHFEFPIIDLGGKVTLEVTAKGYVTQDYTVDVNSFHTMEFFLTPEVKDEFDTPMMGILFIRQPDTVKSTVAKLATITGGIVEPAIQDTTEVIVDSTTCSTITIPPVNGEKDDFGPPAGKEEKPVVLEDTGNIFTGEVMVTPEVTTIEKIKREVKEWLPTKKELYVYPNPVIPGNVVNINLNLDKTGEYKLELMDAAGRVVYVQALQVMQKSQVANVPTQSTWSRGVYWLRISSATDKKVYQAKVLFQ
jgi:hypothetical protein